MRRNEFILQRLSQHGRPHAVGRWRRIGKGQQRLGLTGRAGRQGGKSFWRRRPDLGRWALRPGLGVFEAADGFVGRQSSFLDEAVERRCVAVRLSASRNIKKAGELSSVDRKAGSLYRLRSLDEQSRRLAGPRTLVRRRRLRPSDRMQLRLGQKMVGIVGKGATHGDHSGRRPDSHAGNRGAGGSD